MRRLWEPLKTGLNGPSNAARGSAGFAPGTAGE
jgi:hypothetical protein